MEHYGLPGVGDFQYGFSLEVLSNHNSIQFVLSCKLLVIFWVIQGIIFFVIFLALALISFRLLKSLLGSE